MKLRIAKIDSNNRMEGEFIIQYRTWLRRWRMATFITDGAYDDFHDALFAARRELADRKRKTNIRETWEV